MPISIPKFFQKAFAQNGSKQNVPITGDTSGGRASYDVGFPPVTRVPIVAGGIPPFGTDFNGVLYDLSSAIQYLQSGVTFPFDQDFADAIGGYSVKAIVADPSDPTILWQNNNANNTLPPSVPNGWTQLFSAAELARDPTEILRGAPFLASPSEAQGLLNTTKMLTPALLASAFGLRVGHTFTTNDWAPLPGGLIVQWGLLASGASSSVYPIAFPVKTLQIILSSNINSTSTSAGAQFYVTPTQTGFSRPAGYTDAMRWFAIGH